MLQNRITSAYDSNAENNLQDDSTMKLLINGECIYYKWNSPRMKIYHTNSREGKGKP